MDMLVHQEECREGKNQSSWASKLLLPPCFEGLHSFVGEEGAMFARTNL